MAGMGDVLNAVNALHTRIDAVSASIHARIDDIIPEQPCKDLTSHLKSHSSIQRTWVGELIRGLIAIVVILLTAGVIYAIGWK